MKIIQPAVKPRELLDYVATWTCLVCGRRDAAMLRPTCPACQVLMVRTHG